MLKKIDVLMEDLNKSEVSSTPDYIRNLAVADLGLKERTRKILWEIYEKEGYKRFIEILDFMKTYPGRAFNDVTQVKGEVAEVVLEIIIAKFIEELDLGWQCYKGLIIPFEPESKNTTELDFILVTPIVVTVFEIKSYNGVKTLTGDCFLKAENKGFSSEKDVYEQNKMHIKAFWANFGKHATTKLGVIKSVLFSFASGTVTDEREKEKQEIMPVYDENTLPQYLEALRLLESDPRWEEASLIEALQKAAREAISLEDHVASVIERREKREAEEAVLDQE